MDLRLDILVDDWLDLHWLDNVGVELGVWSVSTVLTRQGDNLRMNMALILLSKRCLTVPGNLGETKYQLLVYSRCYEDAGC